MVSALPGGSAPPINHGLISCAARTVAPLRFGRGGKHLFQQLLRQIIRFRVFRRDAIDRRQNDATIETSLLGRPSLVGLSDWPKDDLTVFSRTDQSAIRQGG